MLKTYLNTTEHDDISITPYLVLESLPELLKDLLRVAKTDDERDMLLAVLPEEFTTGECIRQAGQIGASEKTARRWVENRIEGGKMVKVEHGRYRKCA